MNQKVIDREMWRKIVIGDSNKRIDAIYFFIQILAGLLILWFLFYGLPRMLGYRIIDTRYRIEKIEENSNANTRR